MESQRNRKRGSARARHEARKRRQSGESSDLGKRWQLPRAELPVANSDGLREIARQIGVILRDIWWRLTHNGLLLRGAVGIGLTLAILYFLSFIFSGRISPNVRVMDVDLGGMSVEAAEEALRNAWNRDVAIQLVVGDEQIEEIQPHLLGVRFDALETAKAARGLGLKAIPFGGEVEPIVEIDPLTAQNYLLNLSNKVDVKPYNAGYEWRDGQLFGVEGRNGRRLDVALTVEQLTQNAGKMIGQQQLELLMIPLPPDTQDPTPFMDDVRALLTQEPQLQGYDPYTNQFYTWPIDPETYTSWLAAGNTSLTLREGAFLPFVEALTDTLNPAGEDLRYLAEDETTNFLRKGIAEGNPATQLRIRYHPTTYEVVRGDTAFRISRRTGVPYFEIVEANPGKDLSILSIGDEVNIPTRDITMPETPSSSKRIVVDLMTQYLVAYENGQIIFEWKISSGVNNAPTSPGIYQIVSHQDVAYGSSNLLCNEANLVCGQWEMYWFMGIYSVMPGLVNGFHGDVLLPNGNFLGDGLIGTPTTFGCVMSSDDQAKALYDWAEVGTVVEILSSEYAPMSDLGRLALDRAAQA